MKSVVWHQHPPTACMAQQCSQPYAIWLTGLSGSGKSTLASALSTRMAALGLNPFVLDGDNIRHGLCADLGFSEEDRTENLRRISEVTKLMLDAGVSPIVATISPLERHRDAARQIVGGDRFVEVYVECPVEVCENRDPKGFYRLARQGKIAGFTGVDAIYEPPVIPDVTINTAEVSADAAANTVLLFLKTQRGFA